MKRTQRLYSKSVARKKVLEDKHSLSTSRTALTRHPPQAKNPNHAHTNAFIFLFFFPFPVLLSLSPFAFFFSFHIFFSLSLSLFFSNTLSLFDPNHVTRRRLLYAADAVIPISSLIGITTYHSRYKYVFI